MHIPSPVFLGGLFCHFAVKNMIHPRLFGFYKFYSNLLIGCQCTQQQGRTIVSQPRQRRRQRRHQRPNSSLAPNCSLHPTKRVSSHGACRMVMGGNLKGSKRGPVVCFGPQLGNIETSHFHDCSILEKWAVGLCQGRLPPRPHPPCCPGLAPYVGCM